MTVPVTCPVDEFEQADVADFFLWFSPRDHSDSDIEAWVVTKQGLVRLVGQCFQITGSSLDPVLISLKIFYSNCCKIQEEWKKEVDDKDFVEELKQFLTVLKFTYTKLKPWTRCLVPEGYRMRAIHCHTGGASFTASHIYLIVSATVGKPLGRSKMACVKAS